MSPSYTYPSREHSRHHALTDFCKTRNSLVKGDTSQIPRILVTLSDVSPRSKVTPSTRTCKYFRSPNARPEGSYRETSAGSTGQTVDILVGH